MTGDTSSTNKCSAEWELCRTNEYPRRQRRSLERQSSCGKCVPMHAPVDSSPTVFIDNRRGPCGAEPVCIKSRNALLESKVASGLERSDRKESSPGTGAGSVNTLLPLQQFIRWNRFHRWWRPGLHRLSVGAGPATHRVQDWRNGELAKSRRHLECRSFKPRTTDHYTQVDCSPFGTLFPALTAYLLSLCSKPPGGNFQPQFFERLLQMARRASRPRRIY